MKKQVEVLFIKDLKISQTEQIIAKKGDIKKVRMGYAKNFLIPQKFAKLVSPAVKMQLEIQKKAREKKIQKLIEKLKKLALEIQKIKLKTKLKVGEKKEVFGSVDALQISDLLKEKGVKLNKTQIELKEPIKKIGTHEIPINLGHDIKTKVKLVIEEEK